LVITDLVHQE
jgi:hypothetical protein